MALHLKQNETRSDLRLRIERDLQEKARKRADIESDRPDGVEDSAYITNTKKTTGLAAVWLWVFAAVLVLIAVLLIATL